MIPDEGAHKRDLTGGGFLDELLQEMMGWGIRSGSDEVIIFLVAFVVYQDMLTLIGIEHLIAVSRTILSPLCGRHRVDADTRCPTALGNALGMFPVSPFRLVCSNTSSSSFPETNKRASSPP